MRYKHLFFDLDHTLWDFKTNSRAALLSLYEEYMQERRPDLAFNRFYYTYQAINDQWWEQYRMDKVSKRDLRYGRFRDCLHRFGIADESLTTALADGYVARSPHQTALFPGALEVLDQLMERGHQMHIITNGFEEVQHIKLKDSLLRPYFEHIITSEAAQARKPSPVIFDFALAATGANRNEIVMIGDNMRADIMGAANYGIDQIWFNPHGEKSDFRATFEIQQLSEILPLVQSN